jgi:hypothetical protein
MENTQKQFWKLIGEIIIFGSIWGLLDALSASTLVAHAAPFLRGKQVCTCALVNGFFGLFILTVAYRIHNNWQMYFGIGFVSALFKILNLFILTLPNVNGNVVYQPVVNPALSALATSIVFTVIVMSTPKLLESGLIARIALGAIAGALVSIGFIYLAFYVSRTPPLIVASPTEFILSFHTPTLVIIGTISLPLGYMIGNKLQLIERSYFEMKAWIRYTGTLGIFMICSFTSAWFLIS